MKKKFWNQHFDLQLLNVNTFRMLTVAALSLWLSACSVGESITDAFETETKTSLKIKIEDIQMTEGDQLSAYLFLSDKASESILVDWALSGPGVTSDFVATSGTILIESGSSSASFQVKSKNNAVYDQSRSYDLILIPRKPELLDKASSNLTILDDDTAPEITFTLASQTVSEGSGMLSVAVQSSIAASFDITVNFAVGGTAALGSDFALQSSSVRIPAFSTTVSIPVAILVEVGAEPNETVILTLSSTIGLFGTIGVANTHTITITDGDTIPPSAPVVSGLSTSVYLRPTWTWIAGGGDGNGTYRYKLDDSDLTTGATETTSTSFSPSSNLSLGNHTLYVQERDSTGNWSTSGSHTISVSAPVVEAAYSNGANWNDYVKNDGSNFHSATNTSCAGTENGNSLCLNGGERRKVILYGVSSCAGLTMTDALTAFSWNCVVKTVGGNNTAVFFSTLSPSKGLRDLVNAASWKSNSITIAGGTNITASSSSTAWWSNTVAALTNNSASSVATLNTVGGVYTLSTTRGTQGYNIDADKISVVTLSGSVLQNSVSTNNCNLASGETTAANYQCVISSGSQKFLWIEADLEMGADTHGAYFYGNQFTKVFRTNLTSSGPGTSESGVKFDSGNSNLVKDFTADGGFNGLSFGGNYGYAENIRIQNGIDNSGAGLTVAGNYNTLVDARVANCVNTGISTQGTYNVLTQIRSSNNKNGLVNTGDNNRLTDVITNNNSQSGIYLSYGSSGGINTILTRATTAFNGTYGLMIDSDTSTINNLVSIGNAYGIYDNYRRHTHVNMAVSDSATKDILVGTGSFSGTNNYIGNLLVTSNTSCSNTAQGTGAGITDATCALNGASSGNLFYQGSLLGDFIQDISSNDSSNSSENSSGDAAFPAGSFDWFTFDNDYRVWGKWSNGRWTASTGSIIDFSLANSGTKLYNNSEAVSSTNGAFTIGAACPAATNGNKTATDYNGAVFLLHATEIVDPNATGYSTTGNHNGLCESNESCTYSPNFGVYQGSGTFGACTFNAGGGPVSGVTMYGYSDSGVVPLPTLSIDYAVVPAVVLEGNNATFTVTLSPASAQTVTVAYATAAGTAGTADYTAGSGTLTFAPGETTKTITVAVTDDTLDEDTERFSVILSSSTNALVISSTGLADVTDMDAAPTLSINSPVAVTEGSNVVLTVSLSAASGKTVTVDYASSNTTALSGAGNDYTAVSGTLTFAAGETSKTITVTTNDDTLDEDDETFKVSLSNPTNSTITTADGTGTLADNDAPPVLSVDSPATMTEGNDITFTISLSAASSKNVSFDYATSAVTATAIADYEPENSSLTIPAGSTSVTFTVVVPNDSITEGQETFLVTLSNPTNATLGTATGTGTIDDPDPGVTLSSLSVVAAYPTNGANWNDYVKNDGGTTFTASDTACAGSGESSYTSCIHGGEMRKVVVTGIGSCAGLSMTDALGIFQWTCSDSSGTATFYSTGFQSGKGLKNLLNASSWKSNSVTLAGSTTGGSTPAQWWSNTIQALPDNHLVTDGVSNLNTASRIYTLTSNRATTGYLISANKVALVMLGTAELSHNGSSTNSCGGGKCVVYATSDYFWVEGTINAASTGHYGMKASSANFARTHNVHTKNTTTMGLQLTSTSAFNKVTNSIFEAGGFYAISIDSSSTDNYLSNITARSPTDVVYTDSTSGHNTFANMTVENGTRGFSFNSSDNTVTTFTVSNTNYGIWLTATTSDSNSFTAGTISGGAYGARLSAGADNNTFTNVSISNMTSSGVFIDGGGTGTQGNTFRSMDIFATQAALQLQNGANNNKFYDITASYGSGSGVYLTGTANTGNIFNRMNISNYAGSGINISSADYTGNNFFSDIVVASNGTSGIYISAADNNYFSNITTINNTNYGINLDSGSNNNVFNNVIAANNTRGIIFTTATSSGNSFNQAVSISNTHGVDLADKSTNSKFTGSLVVGNNSTTDCLRSGTDSNAGLVNTTCTITGADGSVSYTSGYLSSATFRKNRSISSSFVAKVTSDDSTNTSDTIGSATFPATVASFDWTNFISLYRNWGKDNAAAFPNGAFQGRWTSGTGRVWDWRLLTTDSSLLYRSGDGLNINEVFVSGANCPSAIHGNKTVSDQNGNTFLMNAVEIVDSAAAGYSAVGDHDGLCESNESCIYSPNFGAYQGHGSYGAYTCTFQDGTVSGVSMHGYPMNGYASNPTVLANNGASYTNSSPVTLNLNPGSFSATEMYITDVAGCGSGGAWETFAYTKSWPLPSTNAANTIYVKYKDASGAESACVSVTITHDNVAPTLASATITTSNPTNVRTWSLTYGATGGSPTQYCIMENNTSNANCVWGQLPLPSSYYITTGPDGAIVLSVWVKDDAGNISSRVDSNSVSLDTTGPLWVNSVLITGTTNSLTVGPTFTYSADATDAPAGVWKYQYAVGSGTSGTSASDIKGWTDAPASPVSAYSMAANSRVTDYYINMRPVDNLGNIGSINSSSAFRIQLAVVAAYPTNGGNWNYYVKNDGSDIYSATDTACAGSESGYSACLHGGEMRKVSVEGQSSCSGLTLTDSLGVFQWTCVLKSGTATFYSTGFQSGKGLKDLLNATSWKSNSVSMAGSVSNTSPSSTWWTNPVKELPLSSSSSSLIVLNGVDDDGGVAGDGSDEAYAEYTILTVGSSRSASGYSVDRKGLAIVTLGSAVLSYSDRASGNCVSSTYRCLFGNGSNRYFQWYEGNFDADGGGSNDAQFILATGSAKFYRIHNSSFKNATEEAIDIYYSSGNMKFTDTTFENNGDSTHGTIFFESNASSSDSNYFENITINGGAGVGINPFGNGTVMKNITINNLVGHGINIGNSFGNSIVRNVKISNISGASKYGISMSGSNNKFYDITISQGASHGILVNGDNNLFNRVNISNMAAGDAINIWTGGNDNNKFVQIVTGNSENGVTVRGTGNKFNGVTSANNQTANLNFVTATQATVNQLVGANGTNGVYMQSTATSASTLSQIVATNNTTGINLGSASSGNRFTGYLLVGNNTTNCSVPGGSGSNPGLKTTTCTDNGTDGESSYTTWGTLSNAVLRINKNLSSTFVGRVSTDGTNNSDTGATVAYPGTPSTFDWVRFDSMFRHWGIDGASWATSRDGWTSGNGLIWDWKILNTDTHIYERSGDGTSANTAFTAGAACPSSVHGNKAVTDLQTTSNTYLLNAYEIVDSEQTGYSATGDHDGLCESNESCFYMPNFGAYMGQGNVGTCTFTDGTVSGVTMYGYDSNGM